MGTRADFYVGIGKNAQWIGSVAYDGYTWEENPLCPLMTAKTEDDFRKAVADILDHECAEHATHPEEGWPWPWNDSLTTDYAYCFSDNTVLALSYDAMDAYEWPDMSAIRNVTLGPRSGLLILS